MTSFSLLPLEIRLMILRRARQESFRKKRQRFENVLNSSLSKWIVSKMFNMNAHNVEIHTIFLKGPITIRHHFRVYGTLHPFLFNKIEIGYFCTHREYKGKPRNKLQRRLKRANKNVQMRWRKRHFTEQW